MDDSGSETHHARRPLALRDQERRRRLRTGRHDFRAEDRRRRRFGEPTWRTWKTGVRARIQPIETKITTAADTPTTTTPYRIFVEENLELDHTCSIRGPDGTIYTITDVIGAERIGELQVIEAKVVASG